MALVFAGGRVRRVRRAGPAPQPRATCSSRTSSTSTSGSTRCSTTRTSSAAIWRSTLVALGAYLAWSRGTRLAIVAAIVSGVLLGGARAQLLDHQLRARCSPACWWSRRFAGASGGRSRAARRSWSAGRSSCSSAGPAHTRRRLGGERQHDDERQGGPGRGGSHAGGATAPSGAGARARSAPRSPATSSGRRRPSPTPSRSPSRPSRGGSA